MRKDKYQVELRVVNGGIERIHRAKRYEEQSALSGRSQESLDLSRAESMVALDKHKPRQASTIVCTSPPRRRPRTVSTSAHIESRFSRLTERPGYGGMDWGARSLLMPDGARTGVLGHC